MPEDRRIRRTKRALTEALIELIAEKGYEKIAITELTERADVAYVSFFRHYDDINQLLMESLHASLSELQQQMAVANAQMQTDPELCGEDVIFEHVEANASLYTALLNSNQGAWVRKQAKILIAQTYAATCPPLHANEDAYPVEIAANAIASGLLGLVEWWLDNDLQPSPQRMGRLYHDLVVEAIVNRIAPVVA